MSPGCNYLLMVSGCGVRFVLWAGMMVLMASCGSGSGGESALASLADEVVMPVRSVDQEVFRRLNAHRTGRGLPPQQRNGGLEVLARAQAQKMLQAGTMKHSDLGALEELALRKYGVERIHENIMQGMGISGPEAASTIATLWINSKGHCLNVESKNTHMGVAVVFGAGGAVYAVHLNGSPRAAGL